MVGILVLAILAVLAIPVSITLLFGQVARLKAQVATLEAQLRGTDTDRNAVAEPLEAAKAPSEPPPPPTSEDLVLPPEAAVAAATPWDRAMGKSGVPAKDARHVETPKPSPKVANAGRFFAWLRDNWVYVISAASLALAGIFFVQYGMETGLLPPGLRVLAALAFGAGLIGAGEWLRRKHGDEGFGPTVNLPSVFSGAGVVTIFAATLAARQLYGLIGPEVAFAGHLATAALAVALGWFSGPLLVAVGLIGATAAPFVVAGGTEAGDWLYGYFALIAAVGLGVDAVRRWAWVSLLSLVVGYIGAGLANVGGASLEGCIGFLVAMVVLATVVPPLRLIPEQPAPAVLPAFALAKGKLRPDFTSLLAQAAMAVSTVALFFVAARQGDEAMLAFASLAGLAVAYLLWAERAEGLADAALPPTLGFLAALAAQGSNNGALKRAFADQAIALRLPESSPSLTASILLIMTTLVSAACAYRALRRGPWGLVFGLVAVLVAPIAAATLELLWQPALVLGAFPWAMHLIALAALMTALAVRFAQADAPAMRRTAHATLSALSLIALALFLLTTKTALTLALSVLIVVAAALDRRFRLPEMSLFLQAGAAVLGYRLLVDPGIHWAQSAPLVQLLLAFGGTIAAMLAALWFMAPLPRPTAKAVAESAAAGLAAILANVLILRWLTNSGGLMESHWGLTLNAMPWLILMLMQLYRARLGGPLATVRRALAVLGGILAGLTIGAAVTLGNPLLSLSPTQARSQVVGPYLLDTLFLAYAAPGLILLFATWKIPGLSQRLKLGFTSIGAALLALYAGLEIRRFWQGDWLGIPGVIQPELYTYTVALMLLGAGLLYQAIAKRSSTLRRIAMAVIAVTVAKVFLIDASGLTGLTRVVSFAGLGLSLAGLAWLNRWAGQAGQKA